MKVLVSNYPDFQSCIDDCAAHGGGTVIVPAGDYYLDMTLLRDNVELHLEAGARLNSIMKPVPDPHSKATDPSTNDHRFLIGGIGIKNASITGAGTIDGCGAEYFWDIDPDKEYPIFGQRWWPKMHRPKGLIHFRECQNIVISGITICNPPCYTVWLLGCNNASIRDITIDTPLESPNTDGLDIDCSSNVRIEGCNISTGDDAIALKSDIHELGYNHPCENITVTNCTLKTSSCGIRLGYEGDGAIRKCVFSNCVIHDSMIGISLMSVLDADNCRGSRIFKGPYITDVIFSDLVIDALQTFNFQHIKCSQGSLDGIIDRISCRNITALARRGSYLGGLEDRLMGTMEFSNVQMTLSGPMGNDFLHEIPEPYPIWNDLESCGLPWAYYARHIRNLNFHNCSVILTDEATGTWQLQPVMKKNVASCNDDAVRMLRQS